MPERKIELPERMFRQGEVVRAEENEGERTVELSFSSELPYERYWGVEILGHEKSEIEIEFLGSGTAPLLVDHNARVDNQVGVIEKVWVADGVGRARVRFGKGARAAEIFERVRDGELTNISVGYRIKAVRLEKEEDGVPTYRATSWRPHEISLVSVPADPTVGIGRADAGGDNVIIIPIEGTRTMPEKTPAELQQEAEQRAATTAAATAENQKSVNDAVEGERKRIAEIDAIAAKFNCRDKAQKAIKDGLSVDAFRGAVLDHLGEEGAQTALTNAARIGLSETEAKRFSFVRALRALANPTDRKAQDSARFEFEVSEEAAKRGGESSGGIRVPVDVLRMPLAEQQRDLTVGTATAGGHTVATNLLASSFIDLLRNRMLVQQLGARLLNDLVGDIAIPRQTGGATAYWVAESGAPTESQQAFDQVTLSPETVGAYTDMSRKLLIQSSIDVEALVRQDLATVLALEIDRVAIEGSGTGNEPQGIINTTGIGSVAGGANGLAPAWSHIVDLETEVSADNADIGALAYFTNAKVRGKLKQSEKASGTAQYIWGDMPSNPGFGMLNGYRAGVSNQVPSDLTKGTGTDLSAILYGNWADLLIGMWSGLDLTVDPYTQATSGTVRVVTLQDVDIAVRHAESFAAMLDAITA